MMTIIIVTFDDDCIRDRLSAAMAMNLKGHLHKARVFSLFKFINFNFISTAAVSLITQNVDKVVHMPLFIALITTNKKNLRTTSLLLLLII